MSHRGFKITTQRREERRKAAEERQKLYDALTLQQKLEKLPFNGAKRQRARFEATAKAQQIKAEQAQQASALKEAAKQNNPNNNKKEGK
jgi:hypothetical protein